MTRKKCLSVLCLVLGCIININSSAVTYKLAGGRLGDQLINYMHAKWISYKYGIPLFYRPFAYSQNFAFHEFEKQMPSDAHFDRVIHFQPGQALAIEPYANVLYEISFFPDNVDELTRDKKKYSAFGVDWGDRKFCELMRRYLQPTNSFAMVETVSNVINVALHVRRGGGFDHTTASPGLNKYRADLLHPARFPPDEFFYEQVTRLIKYFSHKRLSFFIFTDDPRPTKLVEKYKKVFPSAEFRCRAVGGHSTNVVDDLFSMARFDLIVRPQSNFSLVAARIGEPMLEIWPEDCTFNDKKWRCSRIACNIRSLKQVVYNWANMPKLALLLNFYNEGRFHES